MGANQSGLIFLITGAMAAGKSTVAAALAERFERSVHLRGDSFRRCIVRGRSDMGDPDAAEAYRQLLLRYELSTQAALGYATAGFTVVYQDVILGEVLEDVTAGFRGYDLNVVVLCPSSEVIASREASRDKTGYGAVTISDLQHALANTPRIGYWLDTSDLDPKETVDAILRQAILGSAVV